MGMEQLTAKANNRMLEKDVLGNLHMRFFIVEKLPGKSYLEEEFVYWLPFFLFLNLLKTFLS